MRRHLFLLLPLTALAGQSGCSARRSASDADAVADAKTYAPAPEPAAEPREDVSLVASRSTPTRIVRREVVPNGVQTASGLTVPRGFKVNKFAENLDNPRRIAIVPGGTPRSFEVMVTESSRGRVRTLRESNGDGKADGGGVFLSDLRQPYGLAFHPAGWLYVAETHRVVRVPWKRGQAKATKRPQRIAPLVADGYNNHWTRNLLFSRDFKKLYATVGSSCNTCEEESPIRATILEMNPAGGERKIFASGLRNPVGMAWRPGTNELWSVINERDNLGDDVPPDYLTRVDRGRFYGWPYAYTLLDRQVRPDPTFGRVKPRKVAQTTAPTVPVQAHSAALGVAFYTSSHSGGMTPRAVDDTYPKPGARPFPKEYEGDAFLAYHGSWNRSAKTGYKIVRVHFQKGRPTEVTDFVRGEMKGGEAWGRPVDVQIAPDGSLLFSDDGNGIIWRVSRV
jgi:glucose/arabinose dehydrogenase